MKRTGNLIQEIADTDNLLMAYYKAAKGKWRKSETSYATRIDKGVYLLILSKNDGEKNW